LYAELIVDISHEAVDKSFTYRIPEGMVLHVGDPVLVPFGRGKRKGYVLSIKETTDYPEEKIREIRSLLEKEFSVEEELLGLALWMSEEYGSSLVQCLKTVLPVKKKVRKKTKEEVLLYKREKTDFSLTAEQEKVLHSIQSA